MGSGTCAFIYFYPRMFFNVFERVIVERGLGVTNRCGSSGIPVNSLCAMPGLASRAVSKSKLMVTGTNHDTLYTIGLLDLRNGPQVLHVPDMAGRYYDIEFVDRWLDVFAYVGRRTTGTKAGEYLIRGPGWHGALPKGVSQIFSPSDRVVLIGRVLVYDDGDATTAYNLAKQIQVVPLTIRQPSR